MSLDSSETVNSDDNNDSNTTVTFRQWLKANQTIKKTILEKGTRFLRPQLESICLIVIDCIVKEDSEYSKEFNKILSQIVGKRLEHKLGSAETKIMSGLEKLIMTMTENEVSKFIISSQNICDEKSIVLKITLYSFTAVKPIWEMTSQEKYNLAFSHKERGTDFFKDGNVEAAFVQYSVAIKYIICMSESSVSNKQEKAMTQEHKALKSICYLNMAACHSKIANHSSVISSCTKALAIDAQNVKGYYRRAQAYKAIGKIDEARLDLNGALKIEPQNKAVFKLLKSCKS